MIKKHIQSDFILFSIENLDQMAGPLPKTIALRRHSCI